MHYGIEQDRQNLDYFTNKTKLESSGTLMATVVLYLSNATQGGQILFPESVVSNAIGVCLLCAIYSLSCFGPIYNLGQFKLASNLTRVSQLK